MQFFLYEVKANLRTAGAAVTFDVSQALLCYAKKTKRNIRWDCLWNIHIGEFDPYFLQLFKLFAISSHPRDKPKSLQCGRMLAMRQGVQNDGELADRIPKFVSPRTCPGNWI